MSLVILSFRKVLNMTKVCKTTLFINLLVLHLTPSVFSTSSPSSAHYGRGQRAKHYTGTGGGGGGGNTYHTSKALGSPSHTFSSLSPVTSHHHNTESDHKYEKNGRNSGGRRQHHLDNISGSSMYSIVDSGGPPLSGEYLDQFQQSHSVDSAVIVNHQQMSTCQTVCACKWKGGKQTVECIDRLLQKIPDNIDPSTQVLDMSGNKLQTLLNEQFVRANLLNLQKLYLRSCQIEHIEPQTFKGLTNLVELDLSQNRLLNVPSVALSYMSSLRDLTIASNRIQKIEPNAFSETPALHKLDLSHCDIQVIAPQAFEGLDGLTLLRLNGNKLSELVPKTIETLSRLHGIELHDNPWMCDCRLRDAKLWLMQKNIPYPVAPVCAGGPERVIDQTFAELSIDDFACKPEILPSSHYVEATMGENASILCRAKAIPSAAVNWYWNGRLLANNTAFSSNQRIHILEHGGFEKTSRLILTNAQEIDSSEFYCVAENRAGSSEANFTLHVRMRAAGMASLGSGQIVGLSAALVILIFFVLIFVLFLLMRLKKEPYNATKTPNNMEVITSINQQNVISSKAQSNGINGTISSSNGGSGDTKTMDDDLDQMDKDATSMQSANPLQKPPRLMDMAYSLSCYDKHGSGLATAPCFISPTASAGNNPDLINDTKRYESDEFTDLKIPPILMKAVTSDLAGHSTDGEYKRAGGCDSLYPSGLWEDITNVGCTSSADDLFLRRYSDKTPIMNSTNLYDFHDGSHGSDNFSKTFPRTNYNHSLQSNSSCINNTESTASTTTTNLSTSGSGNVISGYPNDYGLPVVPGAELQLHHSMQMNPLQKHLFGGTLGRSNLNNNSLGRPSVMSSTGSSAKISPPLTSRTLPRRKPNSSLETNSSTSTSPLHNSNNGGVNSSSVNAKTIRVWQKGGVPVLPPVTAIKRALINTSRNSPDEGYQEGCGTDV